MWWGGGGARCRRNNSNSELVRTQLSYVMRPVIAKTVAFFSLEICVSRIVPNCDDGISNGEYTRASKFPKIIKKKLTIYFKSRV